MANHRKTCLSRRATRDDAFVAEKSNRSGADGKVRKAESEPAPSGKAESSSADIPAHSVRVSARARRIGLRVSPDRGLEVVLPQNADPSCVPLLLARHRRWIEKQLQRLSRCPDLPGADRAVPEAMLLKGGEEEVRILRNVAGSDPTRNERDRIFMAHEGVGEDSHPRAPHDRAPEGGSGVAPPSRCSPPIRRRCLILEDDLPENLLLRLREWVREEARLHLGAMLRALAQTHGFVYSGVSVRFQRGRWGSCSARGGISLNAGLLFLPERLTRHILLHELCHTRQMNHSPAFWKELFSVEPDALACEKAMRYAWRHVPAWLFA
jgi:predicted metal-dependent hydrolase